MTDYARTLRGTVLHSADVLPDMVAEYLTRVAQVGANQTKQEVFDEFRPLVDHLAQAYVDFSLDVLVQKRFTVADKVEEDSGLDRYGMAYFSKLFPVAPVQGPFLYLLRKNPEEGIRLVLGLANAAVANWRVYTQQAQHREVARTPLPVTVRLADVDRDLWGDAQVYRWFRPSGVAPDSVGSALMALEVWLEERLEEGDDAEVLFEKVIAGSDCVAAAGVCLSVALAYPDKCLKAALPLIASPMLWFMDVERVAHDSAPVIFPDLLGHYEHIDAINSERNKRPQRGLDVRGLSMHYIFQGGDELRSAFKQAVDQFTDDLPAAYAEDREQPAWVAHARDQIEKFQWAAERSNWRGTRTETGVSFELELPDHIKTRGSEILAATQERTLPLLLGTWARKTIETGVPDPGLDLRNAVDAVKKLQRTGDYSEPYGGLGDGDAWRLEAIAAVAAAMVVVSPDDEQRRQIVPWARSILLDAARLKRQGHSDHSSILYSLDPKVSAAQGLCELLVRGEADDAVREQILALAGDTQFQVLTALFTGLATAWESEPRLCWAALSFCIAVSLRVPYPYQPMFTPRDEYAATLEKYEQAKKARFEQLLRSHRARLKSSRIPRLPRVPATDDSLFFAWDRPPRALNRLPLALLMRDPMSRKRLLALLQDCMNRTIVENSPRRGDKSQRRSDEPAEWNRWFLEWASLLSESLSLDETRHLILNSIRDAWKVSPQMTAKLLRGWIYARIATVEEPTLDAQVGWKEICDWTLDSDELREIPHGFRYLPQGVSDCVDLIVFGNGERSVIVREWNHAHLFTGIVSGWVERVGHYADPYSSLLIFLEGPGWSCMPEPALEWLDQIVQACPDIRQVWSEHRNGLRTAGLLQRMFEDDEGAIVTRQESLRRFTAIVDKLADAGVPLAAHIQRRLENRR